MFWIRQPNKRWNAGKTRSGFSAKGRVAGLLLLLVAFFGQTASAQMGHLGPKIAYQSVWLLNQNSYGLSEMDYAFKGGLAYGASIGVDYGEHWGLQLEFQYAHMGQDYEDGIGLSQWTGSSRTVQLRKNVDIGYAQVPVLARYRNGGDKAVFLAVFGPQVGIRGEVAMEYIADGETVPFAVVPGSFYREITEPAQFFEALDFGLSAGAGGEFYFGSVLYGRLLGRMYLGLTDVNTEPTRGAPEYQPTRNFSLGLEAGLGLRFGQSNQPTWTRKPGR
jgi:hypothetical protein